ncbi:MAG: GWxTD domain-containing protein, partial [Thermoanaerobaculia bacterium]
LGACQRTMFQTSAENLSMNRLSLWLTAGAVIVAANIFAQISPQYRNWGNSAVHYLMMKHEKTDWASLRTDADAKAFIDLFWARRDPTPDTPVNELRQQFETRIAEADKRFGFGKTPGSQTDRGVMYALLGQPTEIVTRVTRSRASSGSMSQFQRPITIETWIYRNEAAERVAGTKSFDIAFNFHDEKFAAEFELDGPSQQSFESTALVVAKAVLKRPFLTATELASGAESAHTVPLRLIVVADNTIAHDVLRRAQEGENFADLARKYSSHPSAQQGGYVGRVPFADLTDDFKVALAGKEPGAAVLISRSAQFAIVRLLTEAEARSADAEMPAPK